MAKRKDYQPETAPYNPWRDGLSSKKKHDCNYASPDPTHSPDRNDRYTKKLLEIEWDRLYWRGSRIM